MTSKIAGFVGRWELIVDSCDYEQGEPPHAQSIVIEDRGEEVAMMLSTVERAGDAPDEQTLRGLLDVRVALSPDGPVDAMEWTVKSPRELTTTGYRAGQVVMVAQRQLDDTGQAMRVVQQVTFAGGTTLTNVAVYRRT